MKRGDIFTVAPAGEFGKPRPAVVLQTDLFRDAPTVTFLPITSDLSRQPLRRVSVLPMSGNGLIKPSEVMVDLIQTASVARFGARIGQVDRRTMRQIEVALMLHLGLA